jgi:hypothetical protein
MCVKCPYGRLVRVDRLLFVAWFGQLLIDDDDLGVRLGASVLMSRGCAHDDQNASIKSGALETTTLPLHVISTLRLQIGTTM